MMDNRMERAREASKVMAAYSDGARIECKSRHNRADTWNETPVPGWDWGSFEYRVRVPKPDAIDWSCVAPQFKFMARDKDGRTFLYEERPERREAAFITPRILADYARCDWHSSYKAGDFQWMHSLVLRPE